MTKGYLIGIDEAGRGPLAGPISVGVFSVKDKKVLAKFKGVKDSKQLSEKQREEWFEKIKKEICRSTSGLSNKKGAGDISYAVSFSSAGVIDSKGLTRATKMAMNRCLKRLEKKGFAPIDGSDGRSDDGKHVCKILLDGSLYAPSRYKDQKTIIGGDAKEPIIALASICAKVLRDRKMKRLAKEFPGYGFEIHKGYGTKAHYKAIKKHGMSPVHRRSFLKNLNSKKS
jgi:ribonuclease HII